MADFDREYFSRRLAALKTARQSYETQWRDIETYILPASTEFQLSDTNDGRRKNQSIYNDTATDSVRTLSSGMMGGLTSPARPWFSIRTSSPERNKMKAVSVWLETVTKNMHALFQRSNLYQVLPQAYEELGCFGTTAFLALDDDESVVRFYQCPIGSYYLSTNHRGAIDTFAREFQMTARQMVDKFGEETVSKSVKNASKNTEDAWFSVTHFIEPNPDHDPKKPFKKAKAFKSVYFEPGEHTPLVVEGFDEFPVIAARWIVRGQGIYGVRCPGIQCLGDVKALQLGEKRGWKAIDKLVDPPMTGPTSLKTQKVSLLPGDVTYVDVTQGQQGFRPVYEIRPNIVELDQKMYRIEQRIRRAFYADLFLMISSLDNAQTTATEINARREEKMLMLGPVLERLNDEAFDPLIKRTFGIMLRKSELLWGTDREDQALIPPPPEELGGGELVIEYVSILAQAQKLIGSANLEKLTGFVGNLMGAFPEAADKYDVDAAIDEYAAMVGAPSRTIRDKESVDAIRAQRQQAQEAQAQMQMVQQQAATAKDLGATPITEDTALGAMLGRMGLPPTGGIQ